MQLAINSILVLWVLILTLCVFLIWTVLRFALSTCDADSVTRGLAHLFCLLLLLAGLALGFMLSNLALS